MIQSKTILMWAMLLLQATMLLGQRSVGQKAPTLLVGQVVDAEGGQALEFATISLLDADKGLLDGTITDMEGRFELPMLASCRFIKVEYISYEQRVLATWPEAEGQRIDLGQIGLSINGEQLAEVEITAEKSETVFALDKKVFNVGKDLNSRGGSAQDILDNIPSVSVGVEGDVSLRGNGNVRILVNGKPSGLVGLSDANGLRSIQSSQIERIEVITNPSARYEAEGMAGIINIVLKKDQRGGFNGAFEVSAGLPTTYGIGANVNYRKDAINFFVNYGLQKRKTVGFSEFYQELYTEDVTDVVYTDGDRDRNGLSNTLQGGMEYFISDKQSLTGSLLYKVDGQDNANTLKYYFLGQHQGRKLDLDAAPNDPFTRRLDTEREDENTLEYSLDYVNRLGGKDHKLTASFSYQDNVETESSQLDEGEYVDGLLVNDLTLEQRSANSEGQNNIRLQVDYTRPLSSGLKLETGALATLRQIDNDFKVEEKGEDQWNTIASLTNEFVYNEDVVGAYGIWGHELSRYSYQIGLRAEYTGISTNLITTGQRNDRDYYNLFPSAFFNYKINETNSLQVSYSRRIRRPGFWELNPFFTFTDRRSQFSGNPDIEPEFTNSYELGYLKFWETANMGASVYYRHTTNLIQRLATVGEVNGELITFRKPWNIGEQENVGLEVNAAYTGIKRLRLDANLNVYRFNTTTVDQEAVSDVAAWTTEGRANAKYTFWDNADVQVRARYRGPRQTVQGSMRSMLMVDLGLGKDLWGDVLSLTISVRDVFNQRRRMWEIETDDLYERGTFQWRGRTGLATLSYRINQKKSRKPKRGGGGTGGGEF